MITKDAIEQASERWEEKLIMFLEHISNVRYQLIRCYLSAGAQAKHIHDNSRTNILEF